MDRTLACEAGNLGSTPNGRTKLDFVIFCGGKQRFARRASRRGSQGMKP